MEFPRFMEILDFIGTFAFAISGIRLASAKRFDLFGAYVVGVVAALAYVSVIIWWGNKRTAKTLK